MDGCAPRTVISGNAARRILQGMTQQDPDFHSLPPESRSKIESEFDRTSARMGVGFFAALRHIKRGVIAFLVLLAAWYGVEDLSIRFRIPNNREPFGAVEVLHYYALHLKSGRLEYNFDRSENEVCTNSLFPHLGYSPCWYVRRHKLKFTDI
jgi:hypothetical protein